MAQGIAGVEMRCPYSGEPIKTIPAIVARNPPTTISVSNAQYANTISIFATTLINPLTGGLS